MTIPLPKSLRDLVGQNDHPGLALDKFLEPPSGDGEKSQHAQKRAIAKVASLSASGDKVLLDSLLVRQRGAWNALGAETWEMKTAGPLALHLSRASSLENAGLCLHPIYGFAFIPGSGLKGVARAWAETVWAPAQEDKVAAWQTIESVFGWSPNSDDKKEGWKPKGVPKHGDDDSSAAGSIVFHDGWPTRWPRLVVDIVNSHHGKYYQGSGEGDPPGDWDDPVPVYFLAVAPEQRFELALSRRHGGVSEALLALAKEWLIGALFHLGAGGKTNAGYGRLLPTSGEKPPLPSTARASFEAELELVTPAFLAGANQGKEDCELRPATLRGQLRWWWRVLHAGQMKVSELRELEGALWGTTSQGGAISLALETINAGKVEKFDFKDQRGFDPKPEFSRKHKLERKPRFGSQGIFYAAYGMDDGRRDDKVQRFFLNPGARWVLRFEARASKEGTLSAREALEHARAALYLLCQFGGVGAKSGKGFGSLRVAKEPFESLEKCFKSVGLSAKELNAPVQSPSMSMARQLGYLEIETKWNDAWYALDQVGFALLDFASKNKHDSRKVGLGLPRQIHGPLNRPIGKQTGATHQQPQKLSGADGITRHTSPIHLHLTRGAKGFVVRVSAFPSPKLRNLDESKSFLDGVLTHLEKQLGQRSTSSGPSGDDGKLSAAGKGSAVKQSSSPGVTVETPCPEKFEATLWSKLSADAKDRVQQIVMLTSYKAEAGPHLERLRAEKDSTTQKAMIEAFRLVSNNDKSWLKEKIGPEAVKTGGQPGDPGPGGTPSGSPYEEALEVLEDPSKKKISKKIMKRFNKLEESQKKDIAKKIEQWCLENGQEKALNGWKDLKPYLE